MRPQRFSCGCVPRIFRWLLDVNGFNEAAAIQLRMPHCAFGWDTRGTASMRPQRFSCGCRTAERRTPPCERRFNEAAAIQLRMLRKLSRSWRRHRRFNEAAAIQLRMPPSVYLLFVGHRFASMRPQRFSCGCDEGADKDSPQKALQ